MSKNQSGLQNLKLYLIRPSKYDDEGYVIQHWVALMSNNTLNVLYGLAEDARQRRVLGDIAIETHWLDETVQKIPIEKISRAQHLPHVKVVVLLVGVQTNQFPRAADIARAFRKNGVEVWIGGFHVSTMSNPSTVSPEIQALLDVGVTVVRGEVEDHWDELLRAMAFSPEQPIYDFIAHPPALVNQPLPRPSPSYQRHFLVPRHTTLDTSRGCPFDCNFCSVIHVHGRRMRCRDPKTIIDTIRSNYQNYGLCHYFFTDDNIARNPKWEELFDGLIHLNKVERLPLSFTMQTDLASVRLPNFVKKAELAGCSLVFIGLESLNPENLKDASKRHNLNMDYQQAFATWRAAGIVTIAGYIIGFPHDTASSVREQMRQLIEEVQPDSLYLSALMPLPGSRLYQESIAGDISLETDFNCYDGAHVVMPHPHLSASEWQDLYWEFTSMFYSPENISAILRRIKSNRYWDVMSAALLAQGANLIHHKHPTVGGGVWCVKDRLSRRPGFPIPGRWEHVTGRIREKFHHARQWFNLALKMQDVWLQTHPLAPYSGLNSRRTLDEFWNRNWEHARSGRFWKLQPIHAVIYLAREIWVLLTIGAAAIKGLNVVYVLTGRRMWD